VKYRLQDFKLEQSIATQQTRNSTTFINGISNIVRIVPDVRDIIVDGYDYTVEDVQRAIREYDLVAMREMSNYFYRASLLYKQLILYFANLHRFYWINIPTIVSVKQNKTGQKHDKVYMEVLNYIHKFRFSDSTPDILNAIFREGAFYGYLTEGEFHNSWQQLPAAYCRSLYRQDGTSVVEFNMNFFQEKYPDEQARQKALKKYPAEFKRWYNKIRNGTITSEGNRIWVPLKPEYATRFVLSDDECPVFFSLLIQIIRMGKNQSVVDEQALQQLFKLLVQKMPLNKNDDLIFDIEETKAIHKQASQMLSKAPGVDLFTTWADVNLLNVDTSESLVKNDTIAGPDAFWDESGVSPMLFATRGNLSLAPSQQKDSALVFRILESYATFINKRMNLKWNMKQIQHRFKWLDVTNFNHESMVRMYREQATVGYSKLLLSAAQDVTQAELPGMMELEQHVLRINELLVPLRSSHTMSDNTDDKTKTVANTSDPNDQGGRPRKPDEEKSEETIDNLNR